MEISNKQALREILQAVEAHIGTIARIEKNQSDFVETLEEDSGLFDEASEILGSYEDLSECLAELHDQLTLILS